MQDKDIFTKYYKNNTWRGRESKSGPGSDYENTKFLIEEISVLLKEYKIKSILDIPCGDFNWMRLVSLKNIEYIGADIVSEIIRDNMKQYKKPNVSFQVLDVVNDSLPKVDLVLVRDCFVHLTNDNVKKALTNIKASGSKYLLSTTFTWNHLESNKDINTGEWRRVNLEKSPFKFPKSITNIVEGEPLLHRDKSLGLWMVKDIPDYKDKD